MKVGADRLAPMPSVNLSRFRSLPALALTVALVIAFCLGLRWMNPRVFWNDDYQISILPVLADIARSWREGCWPLLSPYSWACGNLAGEYQYGTFSLFVNAAIVAVWRWPLPFASQAAAVSTAHLAVLAAGCFLLARQRRLPLALASLVGVVGALNGWEICWGATNWFGALAAHAWLPWAWWAFEVAMAPLPPLSAPRRRWRWLLPAPFVYLVLTGGFPYTVVMLGLVSAWLGIKALAERRAAALMPLAAGWIFGLGLSAPAWLSLLQAMQGSGREAGMGTGNAAWTLPLSALPGLILPDWSTNWHNFADRPALHGAVELAGALVPTVGLIAGFACRRGRLARLCRWDLALLGVVLSLCLLPSPGVFRWSFRWLPLLHIILALAGARAWEMLASAREAALRGGRARVLSWAVLRTGGGFWMTAVVALAWLAMTAAGTANPDPPSHLLAPWTLGFGVAWLALETAAFPRARRGAWLPATVALASLWATYRLLPTNPGVPRYAFDAALSQTAPLSPDRLYLGLYPEPEHYDVVDIAPPDRAALLRPGSTNLFAGLRFVNGYSPIMGAGVGRELQMRTHGEIPPEVARDLFTREKTLLGLTGVDGLIVARNYPLQIHPPEEEWTPVFSSREGTVYYRRDGPLPPVVPWSGGSTAGRVFQPTVLENSRLRVVVDVSSLPDDVGGLYFHRPYFPGYEASLDGQSLPVQPFGSLIPSVALPPGHHQRLVLRYRPAAVVWGAGLAGIALAALLLAACWLGRADWPRLQ